MKPGGQIVKWTRRQVVKCFWPLSVAVVGAALLAACDDNGSKQSPQKPGY